MNLDVVFVTYNSEKWINNCIKSILSSDYDLKKVSLLFCDNNSSDNTYSLLNKVKEEHGDKFQQISVMNSGKNLGFGRGNNKAAKLGNSKYILFLNIDTEIEPNTFKDLEEEIMKSPSEVGAWELCQKPYEHPKYYDPYTGYTSWASGACIIIRREIFEKIHGFDSLLFMYAEDVDISWKIRRLGYKIKYLPLNRITHYSYEQPNAFKKTQYIYSLINNLYLRYKYGSLRNMVKGNLLVGKRLFRNYLKGIVTDEEDREIRKVLRKEYVKVQFKGILAVLYNIFSKRDESFKPQFVFDFDYEKTKFDPFYVVDDLSTDGPLVSIIVRTCNRPDTLRETLCSIRNQIYKNIEVVVVEDGPNTSEKLLIEEG